MLGFSVMKKTRYPVIFDVTHSLQQPGGRSGAADGRREHVTNLAKAGLSQGLAGLFLEAHPNPNAALCDGPCAFEVRLFTSFLEPNERVRLPNQVSSVYRYCLIF